MLTFFIINCIMFILTERNYIMFNQYTCNVTTGSTGERTMFMGFDLSNLKVEGALGETPMVDKDVKLDSKVYTVGKLLSTDYGLKYDLILNMMMRDGTVDLSTKVQVGSNGRLREVMVVETKDAYRIWGKTYYGKV